MASSIRIYESEQAAQVASSQLGEAGFSAQRAFLASELAGREEAAVKDAVAKGIVPSGNAAACIRCLKQGRSLVAVNAPLGRGQEALVTLAQSADGAEILLAPPPRDPAPFSDALAIPVLSKFVASSELLSSSCYVTGGFGLVGGGAAPLSSIVAMPTVLASPTGNKPAPKRNPSPFSSALGMPTVLKPPKNWTSSFGYPMLAKNPAPLSALFGMPTLSRG